jgi:hypothetical protein
MAVVTGPNRDRAVARPPWVRRHDNQQESVVAALMLSLVIIGIAVFLFWGQLARIVATTPWFHFQAAATGRPADGAIPAGPAVVVSLDQPVIASSSVVAEASAAWAAPTTTAETAQANASPGGVVSEQSIAEHDLVVIAAPPRTVGEPRTVAETTPAEGAAVEGAPTDAAALAEGAAAEPAATAVPAAATLAPTVTPGVAATARATLAAATPAATAVAAASGKRAKVVRTGGRGVILYSAPREGARLPAGILEGSIVSVLETGRAWTRVQDGGRTGWVRSEFLAPTN